jgi:type I restriction enzyme S subunit
MTVPAHWRRVTFGDLGQVSGGSTPSTKVPGYWGGDIPWLTPSEVSRRRTPFIDSTERAITAEGLAGCAAKLLPPGTVLMTSRATIGEAVINVVPMCTNQGFANVSCYEDMAHNLFLLYWIGHRKAAIESRANGVTFKEISKSSLKSIPVSLPPLPEQQAIARSLRAVQGAIEARRRELELERERKAALTDYLFTYGTRGEPTKQTEIGEMPESWDGVAIGDECWVTTGTTPATDRPEYYGGDTAFVRTSLIANNRIAEADCYITDKAIGNYKLKVFPPGTVFLAMYGQGKTRGQAAILDIPATTSQNTAAISTGVRMDPEYLWQWLMGQYSRLRETGSLGHISHLNLSYVKQYRIPLPPLPEQREIAVALSAADTKIELLGCETAGLEELFKAMLEELMTGRLSAIPLIEGEGNDE